MNLKFGYVFFEKTNINIIAFGLKWVHMARYEPTLRLDGALWLTIISKPPLTQKRAMEGPNIPKESKMALRIRGVLQLLKPSEQSTVAPAANLPSLTAVETLQLSQSLESLLAVSVQDDTST